MSRTKPMLMTAAVLVTGLTTAGAGATENPTAHWEQSASTSDPAQNARNSAAAPQDAQASPRPTAVKPAASAGLLILEMEVIDPEGHPLSRADIGVTIQYSRGSEPMESVFEQARTDAEGRARLQIARDRQGATVYSVEVWAHRAGQGLTMSRVRLAGKAAPAVTRLTLDRAVIRTIAVLGPDDQPVAGLRLAPHALSNAKERPIWFIVPDEWIDRLTATTDAKGVANLTYLPQNLAPMAFRLAGPLVAVHPLSIDALQAKDHVIKLGRPGRVVGVVRTTSGKPVAEVPVELWVQRTGTLGAIDVRPGLPPIKTGPQGAFQTPAVLPSGSTYRVSIRHEGFLPFLSGWVSLDGERATIPDIRLQPLQKVSGRIVDRQGRAVAGARVFVPGSSAESSTDIEGRFALAGINPGKAVILAEPSGFRLRGWVVDPAVRSDLGTLTAVRNSEDAGPPIKPLADPIPFEESRALAARLLEPYLREDPPRADYRARLAAIAVLGEFDLDRALDLLQDGKFPEEDSTYQFIRSDLAVILAETDPASAQAMAEAIPTPARRVAALARIARALLPSERARKRDLLERLAFLLKNEVRRENVRPRLDGLSTLIEQWLDLGDRDRARLFLDEGKAILDSLPPSASAPSEFVAQWARIEPDQVLAGLRKRPLPTTSTAPAVALATALPAEAERTFNLVERVGIQLVTNLNAMQVARRMARVDPPRARRFAAAQPRPSERALAWAYVALGLAESKQAGAPEAVDQAIQEIDRLRESGPGPEPVTIMGSIRLMYPTNPAAVLLPVIERAAPDRLADVFWRAVALHPRNEPGQPRQLQTSYFGFECMLLARHDREVAAVLFQPMEAYLRSLAGQKGPQNQFNSPTVAAMGCIDPRAAVAFVESLMPPREFARNHPVIDARLRIAEMLGLPAEKRWKRLWASMRVQLPLDD
jgi:hypothetical protein